MFSLRIFRVYENDVSRVCTILFIKLSSEAQRATRIVAFTYRRLISQKMLRRHLRWYQRDTGGMPIAPACSALRSCRSNRAGISRDVSPGNSSPSNFVMRLRRTSRTKSRGYARQGLHVDACPAYDRFPPDMTRGFFSAYHYIIFTIDAKTHRLYIDKNYNIYDKDFWYLFSNLSFYSDIFSSYTILLGTLKIKIGNYISEYTTVFRSNFQF